MAADSNADVFARRFPRLHELQALTPDPDSYTAYFHRKFADAMKSPARERVWSVREQDLETLDDAAWKILKAKLSPYLNGLDKEGRGWQQLIEGLNEASAYCYLKRHLGSNEVRFIPETREPTPDLEASCDKGPILCETKTVSESDDEIRARVEGKGLYSSGSLPREFLTKLTDIIAGAARQLSAYRAKDEARRIVFLVPNFNDGTGEHAQEFYRQIDTHLENNKCPAELVVLNRYTRFTSKIAMKNAVVVNE